MHAMSMHNVFVYEWDGAQVVTYASVNVASLPTGNAKAMPRHEGNRAGSGQLVFLKVFTTFLKVFSMFLKVFIY